MMVVSFPGCKVDLSSESSADIPAKAVNQSTCDQAIRQDGESLSLWVKFFWFVTQNLHLLYYNPWTNETIYWNLFIVV